ncbi:hypothetical protein Tco_0810985 [Tanacetum coccineum]
MAQPQRQADVHQDELCPPNKRYALMDANKKIDLEHSLCLNESKILENILQNHLLRFSIVASSSVPWIYLGQFWHTLKEDGSKSCRWLYCFVNNIHGDYGDLLWEGFHYSLDHPTILIPHPRFTKLIVSHYMTAFPEISRRAHDKYHNLDDDEMVKRIFNSQKHKDIVGMKIPKEIEKLVEGTENVEENVKVDSSTLRKNEIKMILTLESSSGQDNESEPGLSTSGNQEELDDFDFWMDSYAIDDDELPTEKVLQEIMDEMSKM